MWSWYSWKFWEFYFLLIAFIMVGFIFVSHFFFSVSLPIESEIHKTNNTGLHTFYSIVNWATDIWKRGREKKIGPSTNSKLTWIPSRIVSYRIQQRILEHHPIILFRVAIQQWPIKYSTLFLLRFFFCLVLSKTKIAHRKKSGSSTFQAAGS